jgi:transglutaminase-like putative cysteine protease
MKRSLIRLLAAYLTAIVPTLVAYRLLNTEGYLWLLTGYPTAIITLFGARLFIRKRPLAAILTTVGVFASAAMALLIAFSLTVTPSSAYIAWFSLVADGEVSGVLSFMFTLKVAFLATAAASAVLRRNALAAVLVSVSLLLLVLYAVYQEPSIMIAAVGFGASSTLAIAVGKPDRRVARRIVPILQVLVLSGLVALPLSRTAVGEYGLLVDFTPTNLVTGILVALFPDFPFLYNMPGYGHRLGETDIGGTPSLTGRPVFEVTGEPGETVYLRTAVYDYFTGKGWAQSTVRNSDLAPPGADGRANSSVRGYYTADPPSDYPRPLRIEVVIDFFSSVPHTLDTEAINFFEGSFPPLTYAGFDSGFLFEVPIIRGTVFYLDRLAAAPASAGSASSTPEASAAAEPVEPVATAARWSPTNLSSYLQLPSAVPDEVRALAEAMRRDDPLDTLENFRRYLTSNFYYSLDPSVPRGDANPAWTFLMGSGGGYCVHFATAFTLLARMTGIPARYVTGFLVNIPSDSRVAAVPGYAAHAWVEVWTPAKGWITQEATPPMLDGFFDDPSLYERYDPFADAYTGRQLELILGDRLPERPVRVRTRPKAVDLVPFLAAFAALLALVSTVHYLTTSSRAPGSRLRRLRLAARLLVKRSIRRGAPDPARVGWRRWAESVDSPSPGEIDETVQIIHHAFFGNRVVSVDDIRKVRKLSTAVTARTPDHRDPLHWAS